MGREEGVYVRKHACVCGVCECVEVFVCVHV